MRALKPFALSLVAIGALFAGQPATAQDQPQVAYLKPFSAEANYMSLPGYFRYLVWERDGIWLSRAEAVALVNNQIEAASK